MLMASPELERVRRLVAAHTPVLRIHPSDRFMPCSAEFFMEHAELLLGEGEDSFQTGHGLVIRPRGSLTAEVLLKAQERYDPALLWMTLDAQSKLGSPMDSLAEVPVYAHVKEVHLSNGSLEALEITYITFYAHNGWYALLGWGPHVGAHDGDWEHLTVRLQAPAYDCQGVWFNAHRPWDGCWVPAHEVERTAEGRPIAYVALHGHGTYPHAGIIRRAMLFANDQCSACGPEWKPKRCVLLLPKEEHAESMTHVIDAAISTDHSAAADATTAASVVRWKRVPSRGSRLVATTSMPQNVAPLMPERAEAVEVVSEPALWLLYRGRWGSTPGPALQTWWHAAECPVSRTPFLRVVGHFWPETQHA